MKGLRKNTDCSKSSSKEQRILQLKSELSSCKAKLKSLNSTDTSRFTKIELLRLERDIEVETRRSSILFVKLKQFGVKENRGRPKKKTIEKYDYVRSKFTAMLLNENLSYLKQLKSSNEIANVSGFLDELIENHRKTCNDPT